MLFRKHSPCMSGCEYCSVQVEYKEPVCVLFTVKIQSGGLTVSGWLLVSVHLLLTGSWTYHLIFTARVLTLWFRNEKTRQKVTGLAHLWEGVHIWLLHSLLQNPLVVTVTSYITDIWLLIYYYDFRWMTLTKCGELNRVSSAQLIMSATCLSHRDFLCE